MKILIKNMVCRHCVDSVKNILSAFPDLDITDVGLGYAELRNKPSESRLEEIATALNEQGFALIQSREANTVEEIKRLLIEHVWHPTNCDHGDNVSEILTSHLPYTYSALSRIFSSVEGRTIENYLMSLRIERVKELIKYGEMTISEIADTLGYSSAAHLTRNFKQVTGMTPTQFREIGLRKSIIDI